MRQSLLNIPRQIWLNVIAILVALSGFFTLNTTLFELKHIKLARLVVADARFTVIAGLSLIYLSMLLRRGKHNAWLVAMAVFSALVIRNVRHFGFDDELNKAYLFHSITNLILPAVVLGILILGRQLFQVKSEILSFSIGLQRAVLILSVAFLYGLVGFQVFDQKDFHQEISLPAAARDTIDQLGLTNNHVTAYSRGSLFFVDSLAALSVSAVFYAAVSLFAPIRFKLSHHRADYELAAGLISEYSTTSEDFFKLWPRDKAYFFNDTKTAMIAYKTTGSVALVVGDPIGQPKQLRRLISQFEEYCTINDWSVAFIHSEPAHQKRYKKLGYESQKIGEEAIIDLHYFEQRVKPSKYFRHIINKFEKLGYRRELLSPPHSAELMHRLKQISDDWLSAPGRSERGFVMGYFNQPYIQLCKLLVVRDADGQVQGFINELPVYGSEANFDFLRHSLDAPGNINDYLLLNFIEDLSSRRFKTLNMGLAPLSGLDKSGSSENALINSFLKFAYENGSRFYSFQGLARFKAKYEPNWQSRYVVYKGGLRGFSRTLNGLIKAMRL